MSKKNLILISLSAILFLLILIHPILAQDDQPIEQEDQQVTTPPPEEQPPAQTNEETKVAKHWSKYKYPETMPPGTKVHIIIKNDTLWDLAKKYLNNNFLWPKIWELNKYITNSHWIYPGDPLTIPQVQEVSPGEIAKTEGAAEEAVEEGSKIYEFTPEDLAGTGEETSEEEFLEDITQIKPIAKYFDLHCYETILPDENMFDAYIISSERNVLNLKIFDYVYIDLGTDQDIKVGDIFSVLHRNEFRPVYHPLDNSFIGWTYENVGKIKTILVFDNFSIARIIENCSAIQVGDQIRPVIKMPVPLLQEEKNVEFYEKESTKSQGYIIYSQGQRTMLAKEKLGVINLGKEDKIQIGDLLTVYRDNAVVGLPRIILGKAVVLIVEETTSVIKILQNRFEIEIGDLVEVR
jgi:hypothetical protein